jgi:hypothetical protein
MSSVPSHNCFLFEKATCDTRLLIASCRSVKLFLSAHGILQKGLLKKAVCGLR